MIISFMFNPSHHHDWKLISKMTYPCLFLVIFTIKRGASCGSWWPFLMSSLTVVLYLYDYVIILRCIFYSPSVEVCTELSWWARRFAWDWRIRDWRHQEGRNGDSGDRGDRGRGARPGDAPHTMGVIPYPWAWLSIRVLLILSWRLILTESAVRSVWAVSISLV